MNSLPDHAGFLPAVPPLDLTPSGRALPYLDARAVLVRETAARTMLDVRCAVRGVSVVDTDCITEPLIVARGGGRVLLLPSGADPALVLAYVEERFRLETRAGRR